MINCNCETENVQKPFDLSCNSCIFNICQLFSIDLPISAINVIYHNDVIDGLGLVLKFEKTARETNKGYFCIFNDAYQKLLEAIKQTPGSLKIDTQRHEKVKNRLRKIEKSKNRKIDCDRSASFSPSSPLGKKFLTIIYYWILEYLESINFFLPLDKMTLNKAVH